MITERKLEAACMQTLEHELPGCWVWKINSMTQGGLPDLEVAWRGHTTKIEFKLLKKAETVQTKWEDQRQLFTLKRYQEQTERAWVVAYRCASKKHGREDDDTLLYKPSALLNDALPEPDEGVTTYVLNHPARLSERLWTLGVVRLPGFNHQAVVELVRQTHV